MDERFIPRHPELLRKCSWIRVYLVIRFVKKKGVLGWRFTSSSGIVKEMFWMKGLYLVIRFVKKKGVLGWSTYHTKKPLGIRGHQYAWELYEIYIRNLILPCFIVNCSKYLCLSLLFSVFSGMFALCFFLSPTFC